MKRILVLLTTMVAGVLLASGVALAAAVSEVEPNNSATTDGAQAIAAASFDLIENANITDSTTVPHATVNGSGNDTLDYYSFTVTQAGTTGTFDIDGTEGGAPVFDSTLRLFDSSGTVLAFNDDSHVDPGSTDDTDGGGSTLDSYLTYTFETPGTYYIEVGECCWTTPGAIPIPIPNTATYQLHVSIANPPNADTTGPTVTDTSPDGTASKTANVTATFSEEVQNVTSSTFILERNIAVKKAPAKYVLVDATVSLSEDGLSAVLDPVQDLPKGDYRATITTDVTDLADNALEEPVVWTFTVAK